MSFTDPNFFSSMTNSPAVSDDNGTTYSHLSFSEAQEGASADGGSATITGGTVNNSHVRRIQSREAAPGGQRLAPGRSPAPAGLAHPRNVAHVARATQKCPHNVRGC